MGYQLEEVEGGWIVSRDGTELARFETRQLALEHVAVRLKREAADEPASLSLKFSPPKPAAGD